MELKPLGIDVVLIQPGDMKTAINGSRLEAQISSNSPYYNSYQYSLKLINQAVENGANPIKVAKLAEKIARKSRPRFRYRTAGFVEYLALLFKALLPFRWFEFLIMKYYRIK